MIHGHSQESNPLNVFEPLIGKLWVAEGFWSDGSPFWQEIEMEYDLDSTLVIVHTKGFTDRNNKTFGPRNHGIRQYDALNGEIMFWEFDVFGGLTKGKVSTEGEDIIYHYQYGDKSITERWTRLGEFSYDYTVRDGPIEEEESYLLKARFKFKKRY